jgi:hypothetical protein
MMMLKFGLCRCIPVYFRPLTAFLVVALCIHASQPLSYKPFLLHTFYMQAIYSKDTLTVVITIYVKLYFYLMLSSKL